MISSKRAQIEQRLLEFASLFAFEYHGKQCDIDPFGPGDFHLCCDGNEVDVHSIDDVMSAPFFDGKCLNDIADQITITEW